MVRGILGLAVPEQVVVDEDDFDENMALVNEDRRARLEALARGLIRYTKLIAMEKAGV